MKFAENGRHVIGRTSCHEYMLPLLFFFFFAMMSCVGVCMLLLCVCFHSRKEKKHVMRKFGIIT